MELDPRITSCYRRQPGETKTDERIEPLEKDCADERQTNQDSSNEEEFQSRHLKVCYKERAPLAATPAGSPEQPLPFQFFLIRLIVPFTPFIVPARGGAVCPRSP